MPSLLIQERNNEICIILAVAFTKWLRSFLAHKKLSAGYMVRHYEERCPFSMFFAFTFDSKCLVGHDFLHIHDNTQDNRLRRFSALISACSWAVFSALVCRMISVLGLACGYFLKCS